MRARRDEILDAALACFAERGYDGATIDEMRERSGASVGATYHHFGGKEQIADALYTEALRNYQSGFLELLRGDAERAIKGVVRHHLRWVDANPDLARFLLTERKPVEVRELNRATFERLESWRAERKDQLQPLS